MAKTAAATKPKRVNSRDLNQRNLTKTRRVEGDLDQRVDALEARLTTLEQIVTTQQAQIHELRRVTSLEPTTP